MSWTTRLPGKVARSLISWAERSADPAEREWIGAMRAELDQIDGGLAQLRWTAGVVPLLWRSYRVDILRCMVCVTAVVAANYSFPKFVVTFQVFLAQATRRLIPGTVIGIGLSLLGLGVLHALGYGSASGPTAFAHGSPSVYVEILFFALVGAAFGTLGAMVGLRTSREAVVRGS